MKTRSAPKTTSLSVPMLEHLGGGEIKKGTTFYVIVSHVKFKEDKTVDVSGVFTPRCYTDWLASRDGKLMKPEKAFYRAFLTHMRGANNRRPFPAVVEEALLAELRKPENIWDRVFVPNKCKIGKYGFTHIAFHEGRSLGPSAGMLPLNCLKGPRKRMLGDDLVSAIEIDEKELGLIGLHDVFSENHLIAEAWKDLMDLNSKSVEGHPCFETSPWDTFWNGAKGHESFMYRFESILKNDGYDVFPPALIFLMQQMPARSDQRFNFDFLFPNPSNVRFNPEKPIGYLKTNVLERQIVDCNNPARELLQDDPTGQHFMKYIPSMMEFWIGQINSFSKYDRDETSWKRVLLQDRNGKVSLFLAKVRMPTASYQHEIFFQDISDQYPEYLAMPFFI